MNKEREELKEIAKEIKKDQKKKFNKFFYIGLGVSFILASLCSVGIFYYMQNILGFKIENSLYHILSDTFLVPAVMLLLFYFLMLVSKEGAFDAISYGVKLTFFRIFYKNIRETKIPSTYVEYRELKRGKERASYLYLAITGSLFLLLAIIMFVVYITTK